MKFEILQFPLAKSAYGGIILPMEEENKSEIFQSPTQYESRLSRPKNQFAPKKIFIILFSIVIVGLIIFGTTRFFAGGKSEQNSEPAPTAEAFPTDIPEPTEEISPTQEPKKPTPTKIPTPKPTVNPVDKTTGLDRSNLSIHVLNGSGAGRASKKASDFLESLGYNVIQIGNAENFNYEKTTIQIKSAKEEFLSLLKKDLSSNYSLGTTSADLASDSRPDTIVIVGKE
ncbi:MAG: hypothetical protein A3C27_03270 [Candidatus Levybacteria bacterium RIFCSPHIGHO2_02_FULL_39_36]|nr:MAG: Cell envelope-related transcriptional attenuator [Candidatus Levybacteria bacterium GW2011_GWA1_39_11]KKR24965.1 MAG: Cell envelope-related transcriptional attenuator [Candidatus Levybacteria bacterium GW2011_GWB1_39_7]KKR25800.1 MAG: Cell envelope-related transcriptional attenuator [Microgenomates group bacterium GW2011_GWC1_39_7]KKR49815.1 MAG: Cell envelope-related transcriptional attenuator [Candidatus Levybacteria bacterium GW2011_GWA2_40_16]OGH14126.1 MAG: hypothetical protein A26